MFLHAQQYNSSTTFNPSMAQTAIGSPVPYQTVTGGIQMSCEGTFLQAADRVSYPNYVVNQLIDPGIRPVSSSYCEAGPIVTTNGNGHQLGGASRKRGREDEWCPTTTSTPWMSNNRLASNAAAHVAGYGFPDSNGCCCCSPAGASSFVGGDIAGRMHKELQELDLLVHMQTEKVRAELEHKRQKYWVSLLRAVEGGVQRILRGKEEELEAILRRNTALEERASLLLAEGQTWKALAQTNEAEVALLRRDLDAAQAREGGGDSGEAEAEISSCHCEGQGRQEDGCCRGCRRNVASVLALPCRHLCLCSDCDSTSRTCPVCMAAKTASLHVYLS